MIDLESEALADCLDGLRSGKYTIESCLEKYPNYRRELLPLLEAVADLESTRQVKPRLSFQKQARDRLLSQMRTNHTTKVAVRKTRIPLGLIQQHRSQLSRYIYLTLAVLVIFFVAGTGTVYASAPALPGDFLYPVKIGVEKLQVTLAPEDVQIRLGIQFMQVRQKEINQLVAKGRYQDLNSALHELEELSISTVHQYGVSNNKNDPLAQQQGNNLDGTIKNNITVLNRVLDQVPPQAQPAIQHAIQVSQQENDAIDGALHGLGHQKKDDVTILPSSTNTDQASQPTPTLTGPGNSGNHPTVRGTPNSHGNKPTQSPNHPQPNPDPSVPKGPPKNPTK